VCLEPSAAVRATAAARGSGRGGGARSAHRAAARQRVAASPDAAGSREGCGGHVCGVSARNSTLPRVVPRAAPCRPDPEVFEGKIRRTKKGAAAVSLLYLWGPEEQAAFKDYKQLSWIQ
jgi:hypothetical protein